MVFSAAQAVFSLHPPNQVHPVHRVEFPVLFPFPAFYLPGGQLLFAAVVWSGLAVLASFELIYSAIHAQRVSVPARRVLFPDRADIRQG